MNALIDLVNDSTPVRAPFGSVLVVAGLFLVAWIVARAAGVVAALLVDRSERRRAPGLEAADTGVISGLRQRETAITLVQTSVAYLAYGVALVLSIAALTGARRIETVVGASFLAIVVAFAAQRFLTDLLAGLLMFFERWFRVGDSIHVEPWGIQGVVDGVSLRSITIRGVTGEVMRVHNSEVKAVRVIPRGYREVQIELFTSELEAGRELVERVARIVPAGPTHFVHRPMIDETEELDADLFRIRARAGVAPGREWLAEGFLHDILKERAAEGLIVHGPIVTPVDEQATRRFARAAWAEGARPAPRRPLRRLRALERA